MQYNFGANVRASVSVEKASMAQGNSYVVQNGLTDFERISIKNSLCRKLTAIKKNHSILASVTVEVDPTWEHKKK